MLREKDQHQIVIVDDESLVLKAFKRQFADDFDVQTFSSAADLLAAVDRLCPSLFIIDWMMPGMDGIALTRELRRQPRFDLVPIAFHTAVEQSKEWMAEAFAAGAQSFISKEGSFSTTLIQIRTLLDNYQKLLHYLEQQKIMLSVLKHDMASLLTGVCSGLEVLALDKVFQREDLRTQMETIQQASDSLRQLFDDLSEVLVVGNSQARLPMGQVELWTIFADLREYLGNIQREVRYVGQDKLAVYCKRRGLGRCLFYLVRLLDGHLPKGLAVTIAVEADQGGTVFRLSAPGDFHEGFAALNPATMAILDPDVRRDILYAQYIKNVLISHSANLTLLDSNGQSEVVFHLAGPA